MEKEYRFTKGENYKGSVALAYMPEINYTLWHNRLSTFDYCQLTNCNETDWHQVKISLQGEWVNLSEAMLEVVPAGKTVQTNKLCLVVDANKLIAYTEGIETTFTLQISIDSEALFTQEFTLRIMPFDHWLGIDVLPELLCSFVTPNHPLLSRVRVEAAHFMQQWTADASLDGYQSKDPNRVRQQVAAIFEALRTESIVYSNPPAGFEHTGQRVRLVDQVLNEKLGTCLDLSLLFASCLEATGIHPLLIITKGHIFVGVWLVESVYGQTVGDDASYLLKGCADGINEIVVVETTYLTSSHAVSFEDAVEKALVQLKEPAYFELFLDVVRCRLDNIRPLPQRILSEGTYLLENEGVTHEHATNSVNQLDRFAIDLTQASEVKTKQMIWERKLLDLSLRNNLINLRLGRRVIPFISFGIDHLEDSIQAGDTFQILPTPTKSKVEPTELGIYDSSLFKTELNELVVNELQKKRIFSYLTESELSNGLKFIYRTSRTALEENGANSLFLVLGVLKWYETERSVKPRFAPILLLPVDIVRKVGTMGYVIKAREEEIILNITLAELLKQQFNIELKGLTPLPTDESGVDVKKVFATIRTIIREVKRWDVVEESMLGLFSFNKFVMWNDIHSNADKLKENKVVASLMENRIQWMDELQEVDAREIDKKSEPASYAIPIEVDSSQMEAVIESGEGKSFILHGPPGTGKSQTITNMIANALYKGKRVLFVAEKMAALSVVQNRLAKIGLGPFCLEMHSKKATKSHFLAQLKEAIEVTHYKPTDAYEKTSHDLFERRKQLIDYMEALHSMQGFGYSLYECITNYVATDGAEVDLPSNYLTTLTKEVIGKVSEQLVSLDTVFSLTGHPQGHPLTGIYPYGVSLSELTELKQLLEEHRRLIPEIASTKRAVTTLFNLEVTEDWSDYTWLRDFCHSLLNLPMLNTELLLLVADKERVEEWMQLFQYGQACEQIEEELLASFTPEVLKIDASAMQLEWNQAASKWFVFKYFAKKTVIRKMRHYKPTLQENELTPLFAKLLAYQRQKSLVESQKDALQSIFGSLIKRNKIQWEQLVAVLTHASELYQLLLIHTQKRKLTLADILPNIAAHFGDKWLLTKASAGDKLQQLVIAVDELERAHNRLHELCELAQPTDSLTTTFMPALDSWLMHYDQLKDWYHWCAVRKCLVEQNLGSVLSVVENEGYSGRQASNAYYKSVMHQLAMQIIDANMSLQLFNGVLFEELIAKYRQSTSEFQQLTKQALYGKLAANVPFLAMEAASNSEVGILKRNIANGGRGTSIRRIIDQIPTLLPKLCPCMLMSPISVAQYLDLTGEKFDVVIFDEASQMPTSEAVGAIARGNALVVVGDPKQMPPTSFFSSNQLDEEEAELDDMESILDDCISLAMPARYLTWHYRSKHESLIAFSNSHYYEGKLNTFPSVDDRASKVSLVPVNGVYDKGNTRSNRMEAEAIVKEIIRRLSNAELSQRSIGVVSFSQAQQNLIEDLLVEELAKQPELEQLAYQGNEPIFIKNLENVQGDERDVILFSIGYGADKDGKVSMNFGPLNNKGGGRRLNVAVSRSRYEMVVFSSLRSEQIDLKRTKAIGVEGLKRFLEFAEKGTLSIQATQQTHQSAAGMVELIAADIRKNGYKVDTLVGRSNFKVDLAIVNPEEPDTYLLGILCDGKSYFETKTTRDREVVQPSVLTMLKWNIMRVWSVDWFNNKERVLQRILKELENLKNKPNVTAVVAPTTLNSAAPHKPEVIIAPQNERMRKYEFAKIDVISSRGNLEKLLESEALVTKQLFQLIATEQPITNTLLYKRIARIWGIARVTPRLQNFVNQLLEDKYCEEMNDSEVVYWEGEDQAKAYCYYRVDSNREIVDIPLVEVMNAIRFVVEQQIAIPHEDAKRLASQALGFSRKGSNLEAATTQALNELLAKAICLDKEGMICVG